MEQNDQNTRFGQRLSKARPTKTLFFWSWVAAAVATMIVGFTWGGWVMGSTARTMAQVQADDAVVSRLAPICVVQAKQDPRRTQELRELNALGAYERGDYVKKRGWARMPGEAEPDSKVADQCAKLLTVGQ